MDMNKFAMLAFALSSSVGGALLAALVLLFTFPAKSQDSTHPLQDPQAAGIPFCSSASNESAPNFYSEMAKVNARMHESMEIASSGDVDQDFTRIMIPHHQGAIDMALVLLKYGRDERLRRLAQSIIVEQGQEITYMRTLHNPPPAEPSAAHHIADQ
jgi:hypothetical protein